MRAALALACLALAAGCGGGEEEGRATIVAAFYPLAYAAERVAEPGTGVRNLTPPGSEPHDLELSPAAVAAVGAAQLVVYLGQGFQPAVERAIEATGAESLDALAKLELRTVEARAHEDEDGEEHADDAEGGFDPHVWLDPLRYAEIVEQIASALGRPQAADPLVADLRSLHGEFEHGLRDCERRELVASHAAFGYLADRYGLEQVAISGVSPEAEPSPAALAGFLAEVREHRPTTVFFETLVSPKLAETVARELGARTAVLDPLEGLTRERIDRGEDYFSVMRANLAALRKGLECR